MERARKEWQASFWDKAALPAHKAEPDAEIALTPSEIATLRQAVKELSGDPYATALYSDMEALVEAGFVNAKQLLHLEADLKDVKPSFAMDALRKHVEDFTFLVNTREQDYLNQLIDQGLADGWTPKRLSSEIAQAFSDGYHIKDDTGTVVRTIPTDSWSEMVARTELNRAQTLGATALYRSAGVQKVMWVTTGGGDVCDRCQPADGEVVNMGDVFESVGVDAPPAHPRCNCALMAADDDLKYDPEADAASS